MLLIDTYNVLHVTGVLPPEQAGIDLAGLMALIESGRFRGRSAVLVCDGRRPAHHPRPDRTAPIQVVYAGPGRTADDLMITAIDRSSAPRRLTVVSSDQQIIRAARRRRCRTLDSAEFLRQLASGAGRAGEGPGPARPAHPLAEDQVSKWLERFGLSGEEHEEFAPPEEPGEPPADDIDDPGAPGGNPAEVAVDPADEAELIDELLSIVPDELRHVPIDHGSLLPPEVIEEAERLAEGESPEDREDEKPK